MRIETRTVTLKCDVCGAVLATLSPTETTDMTPWLHAYVTVDYLGHFFSVTGYRPETGSPLELCPEHATQLLMAVRDAVTKRLAALAVRLPADSPTRAMTLTE